MDCNGNGQSGERHKHHLTVYGGSRRNWKSDLDPALGIRTADCPTVILMVPPSSIEHLDSKQTLQNSLVFEGWGQPKQALSFDGSSICNPPPWPSKLKNREALPLNHLDAHATRCTKVSRPSGENLLALLVCLETRFAPGQSETGEASRCPSVDNPTKRTPM